jgi:uncharacterized protein YjbJ (UPF0337 family)
MSPERYPSAVLGAEVSMKNANMRRAEGKVEEVTGAVKAKVGEAIGNEQMEVEGRTRQVGGQAKQTEAKAEERTRGTVEQVAGKVKGAVGAIAGNNDLEAEGKIEDLKGKARRNVNR